MRQVYRLLGLAKRYGSGPTDTACGRALDLDVVAVAKIASMLERGTENTRHRRREQPAASPWHGSPATLPSSGGPHRPG